jgi:Resolvase, N terminal domain
LLVTLEGKMSVNVIAYYRVSTQKQGRSGLGLEAQRAAVERFAEAEGFLISAEHIEIETGKGADALERRPELAKAQRLLGKTNAQWSWLSWIGFLAMSPLSPP